jgi:hypothetical protein
MEYRVKTIDHYFDTLSQDNPLTEYLDSSSRISFFCGFTYKNTIKKKPGRSSTLMDQSKRRQDKLRHLNLFSEAYCLLAH